MNVNSAGDSAYHFHLKVIFFLDKQVSNIYLQFFHGQRRMSWTKYLTRWLSFIIGSISRSNFCHESLSPRQFSYHTEIPYPQAHSSNKSWCKNYYIILSSKINVLAFLLVYLHPNQKKMSFKKIWRNSFPDPENWNNLVQNMRKLSLRCPTEPVRKRWKYW